MKTRIAAVSFLNALPLIEYFDAHPDPAVEVTAALPSQLGDLLWEDEADVALLPVVEHFRGQGAGIVPGIGIATTGKVDSVKLFSRVEPAAIGRVTVDRGSRTSVALLRILLAELYDTRPDLFSAEPRPETLLDGCEAALVIGDRCFAVEQHLRRAGRDDVRVHDLGQMWHRLTGLPFVFAAWAMGPDYLERTGPDEQRDLVRLLTLARDHGLGRLDELADRAAAEGRLGPGGLGGAKVLRHYFRRSLTYVLGDREMAGLHRFYELCVRHAICPAGRSPRLALSGKK